ncbi:hypothetical protein HaLaN_26747, partial [Haematococcus lacustris]
MHSGFAQLQADLDPLARTLKASKAPPQGQRQILVSQMSRTVSFVAMLVVLAVTVQGRTLTQQSGASATAVAQALVS